MEINLSYNLPIYARYKWKTEGELIQGNIYKVNEIHNAINNFLVFLTNGSSVNSGYLDILYRNMKNEFIKIDISKSFLLNPNRDLEKVIYFIEDKDDKNSEK